jgi:hypothetical protein
MTSEEGCMPDGHTLIVRLTPAEKAAVDTLREHLRVAWPGARLSGATVVRFALADTVATLDGAQEQLQPKPAACRRR